MVADPILSCSENAVPDKVDSCCAETFGGLVVCLTTISHNCATAKDFELSY